MVGFPNPVTYMNMKMSRFIVATLCKVFTTLKGCKTLHGGSKEVVHEKTSYAPTQINSSNLKEYIPR